METAKIVVKANPVSGEGFNRGVAWLRKHNFIWYPGRKFWALILPDCDANRQAVATWRECHIGTGVRFL